MARALFVATLLLSSSAFADADRRAMQLERTLMSPFCPGKTLHGCPSPRAAEWRADIREWVDEGVSGKEIHDRLQARAPRFDLLARPAGNADWGIPVGAASIATLVLIVVARRWRPRGDELIETSDPDEYDDRLDDELARLDA